MHLQFSIEDLRTPEALERVLRQLESHTETKISQTIQNLDPNQLALSLAPLIRTQLQATGQFPLNLQSLLPSVRFDNAIPDTHANRLSIYPPSNYNPGQLFYETDRTVTYIVVLSNGTHLWRYYSGIYYTTLANIPADLGVGDTDFLFNVTDYSHTLRWQGGAWGWGPEDEGSGFYRMYEAAPAGFGASAWQVCDGSTIDRLNADGTTTSVTVPSLGTPAYLKGGTSSAAVAAASGTVADESAHTHPVTSPTGAPSATVEVAAGTGTIVATDTHTHAVTSPTGAGSAHNHGPGTLELRNKQTALYYRR